MSTPKTVLIAEDEESIQKILVRNITSLGYTVVPVSTGEEAVRKVHELKPDLILLDVIMPIKNGFDVLQELRVKDKDTTPVIVITNLDSKQDMESAKGLGISGYITKSDVTLRDLAHLVTAVMDKTTA